MNEHSMNRTKKNLTLRAIRLALNGLSYPAPALATRWVFHLFRKPRKGRLSDENKAFLQSATWRSFEQAGTHVQCYHWAGDGPTVLLLHGWESNSARWEPLIEALRGRKANIVAMDAPGHGGTDEQYFTALRYSEMMAPVVAAYQPAIVIGHSAGGMACAHFVANTTQPHSLRQMALLGTPENLEDVTAMFMSVLPLNQRIRLRLGHLMEALLERPTTWFSMSSFARQFGIGGIVIHDKEDTTAPLAGGLAIHRHWAGSRLLVTEGLGHRLQGQVVIDALLDLLDEVGTV